MKSKQNLAAKRIKNLQGFDLNASRQDIQQSVAQILGEIEEGNIDPMEYFVFSHKLLEFATLLHAVTKEHLNGQKGDFYGLRISEAKTGSTFDYTNCGSRKLEAYLGQQFELKTKIEQEQALLKSLRGPLTVVDEDTGEVFEIRPPVNKFEIRPKVDWL